MLVRPDKKLLRTLIELKGFVNWDTVLTYLDDERKQVLELLADSPDDLALRRLQGRARLLKEISELFGSPDEFLNKLDAPKRQSDFF